MTFMPWTEIESFHNVRKFMNAYPENLNGDPIVLYRSKVKLHGTNAAVQVHANGALVAQSRTTELSVTNDNAGFAKWVHSTNPELWQNAKGLVIFGEWCGPGVQKGVAISEIPKKIFAVFAARSLDTESDELIVEPDQLSKLICNIADLYVLPWYKPEQGFIVINWLVENEDKKKELQLNANFINNWVNEVEKNDPWVKETFNVNGTGEGLVFYPLEKHSGIKNFNNLVFKAKGEKHKNIKTSAPAQVNPEAAANVDQFVDLVLTEARLVQGAQMVLIRDGSSMYEMKVLGNFLKWIIADVQKETQDELEASNLTWDQVNKAISNKARAWYLAKAKAL